MRIRTYIAGDVPEALALIREEMGDDAIIVSTETRSDGRCRVVAACEEPGADRAEDVLLEPFNEEPEAVADTEDAIEAAMREHGVPDALARHFVDAATGNQELTPEMAMAAACEDRLQFGGAPFRPSLRPIVLVGPPGAGKTTTAAKLAAHALVNGIAVDLMAADMIKTGALEQLKGLAERMKVQVHSADNSAALASGWRSRRATHEAAGRPVLAIVDTTGANPFDDEELARAGALIAGLRGHGVLVLPAGGDPLEAADTARAFAEAGATHLIVTRVDAARRLGGLLTAAAVRSNGTQLKLSGVGISPQIGNGLRPVSPLVMARLLMTQTERAPQYQWHDFSQEECA